MGLSLILDAPTKPLRPPLKWAGGKRWLVPELQQLWRPHETKRLVEPFCGGIAITMGLLPKKALLNDVNPHLINFYRQIQLGLTIQNSFQNQREYYFESRTLFNNLIEDNRHTTPQAAELFYYLNRTGFNGLCRFNSKGLFNVPFGRYTNIEYAKDFLAYKPLLSTWEFCLGDFEDLNILEDDFLYVDPPYDVEFVSYSKDGFSWDDQKRLAHWLANKTCPTIASNQATQRITDLYKSLGFEIVTLNAPRMISCTGDRTQAKEMLAYKNL
jgi:DNA adenine methylase